MNLSYLCQIFEVLLNYILLTFNHYFIQQTFMCEIYRTAGDPKQPFNMLNAVRKMFGVDKASQCLQIDKGGVMDDGKDKCDRGVEEGLVTFKRP